MIKQQNGFHVLYVLLLVAVLGVIGFAGYTVLHAHDNPGNNSAPPVQTPATSTSQTRTGPNYKALANCGSNKAVLNTVPVDTSKFYQIMPLGNQGVPDHTMPADHLYFAYITPGETAALSSPGKIVITGITYSGEKSAGGINRANDYEIMFSACKGVDFDFAHISSLASALQAVAPKDSNDSSCSHDSQAAGVQTFYCNKSLDLLMQPGEPIGTVGGPNLGAFDFGTHNSSYKDPGYVDTDWHVDQTAVCGLDYFTPDAQAQLYTLVKRTAAPRCGQIGQDKANTLQGDWFATNDHSNAMTEWNKHLSIIHNNVDPTVGELAVGGTLGAPAIYLFNPTHSGTTNHEPGETAAGKIYCYQNETTSVQNNQPGNGKILLQLISNHEMKAEDKTGACTSNEAFESPTTYYR